MKSKQINVYSSIRQLYCCDFTDIKRVPPERATYTELMKPLKINAYIANLCPIIIHFNALDFNVCRSEEVSFDAQCTIYSLVNMVMYCMKTCDPKLLLLTKYKFNCHIMYVFYSCSYETHLFTQHTKLYS